MGGQQHCFTRTLKASNFFESLVLERLIAHADQLIDQQNIGVGAYRHRERQPQNHSSGVGAQRLMDELAYAGKLEDVLVPHARGLPHVGRDE